MSTASPLLLILKVLQFPLYNPEMYAYVGTANGVRTGTTQVSNLDRGKGFLCSPKRRY